MHHLPGRLLVLPILDYFIPQIALKGHIVPMALFVVDLLSVVITQLFHSVPLILVLIILSTIHNHLSDQRSTDPLLPLQPFRCLLMLSLIPPLMVLFPFQPYNRPVRVIFHL